MQQGPSWAALTTWIVVNIVNVAQAVGFASRSSHGMAVNRALGLGIATLAIPASAALVGFARAGNPSWIGPLWLVTVVTTGALLITMTVAIRKGTG